MTYRIAVASTDGVVVNQHFGHADSFLIFELDVETGAYRYFESRKVNPVCQGHAHEAKDFDAVLEVLSDVQAILVAKIGTGASAYLERKGLTVYEAPFAIEDVLDKILEDSLWEVDLWRLPTKS